MSPDEYCQEKTGGSGSSFYYSFLFLPPERRRAITALYAYCREVDDTVDDCREPQVARAKLHWWRDEIDATFRGSPNHPVSRALVAAIEHYHLPPQPFHDILNGMEMDLDQQSYARFDDLQVYCQRVASAVGLLSARIFGYSDPATLEFAHRLGIALQLINIIRDVGEDARRQRLYLPLDDLARFQINPADILQVRTVPQLPELMEFQAARAERYYHEALAALPDRDRCAQLPSLIMAAIYRATLEEIRADGFRVLQQRISLPPLRKLWIAWKTQRQERRWQRRSADIA